MKNKEKKFIPFGHENLDLKKELVNHARSLKDKTDFDSQLVSTFLYISFAEYLGNHLLVNLRHLVNIGTYNQFAGILFIDETDDSRSKTIGQILKEIDKFDFPDKKGIKILLSQIQKLRNKFFHTFIESNIKELEKMIKDDLPQIREKTEDLITKIDVIYAGLWKILNPKYKTATETKTEDVK